MKLLTSQIWWNCLQPTNLPASMLPCSRIFSYPDTNTHTHTHTHTHTQTHTHVNDHIVVALGQWLFSNFDQRSEIYRLFFVVVFSIIWNITWSRGILKYGSSTTLFAPLELESFPLWLSDRWWVVMVVVSKWQMVGGWWWLWSVSDRWWVVDDGCGE